MDNQDLAFRFRMNFINLQKSLLARAAMICSVTGVAAWLMRRSRGAHRWLAVAGFWLALGPLVTLHARNGDVVTAQLNTQMQLNTLKEVFARVTRCWQPPELPSGTAGMQITVLVSFKRSGEILGKPKITFETPNATEEERLVYRTAIMQSLHRCTPLPLTESLGGAIAGRPMTFRFDDRRRPAKRYAQLNG